MSRFFIREIVKLTNFLYFLSDAKTLCLTVKNSNLSYLFEILIDTLECSSKTKNCEI